ncbi:MAG: FHA domain-containing protein [Xanthomonadales bacterium]|nr:FHA domain-containing protein [Xanthomonadales bacterium]
MKLAFPNGEHADVAIGKGSFSIGNSNQDDVIIEDGGARGVLIIDQRGITLAVEDDADGKVSVNSRPIREKAILRLGDRIKFGSVDMVIRSDAVDMRTPPHPFEAVSEDEMPTKHHLRGITGQHAGKVFPIRAELTIGSGDDSDIQVPTEADVQLAVGCKGDKIYLRRMDGQGTLDVNGHEVKHAELNAGDQIAIGEHRFLLETPGFVPGDVYGGEVREEATGSNTQVFSAKAFNDAARQAEQKKAEEQKAEKPKAEEPKVEEPKAEAQKPQTTPPSPPQPELSAEERAAQEERNSRPTRRPPPPKPKSEPSRDDGSRRDMVIIGICVVLSAAMVIWLILNL